MASDSARVANMARILALVHIIVGFLLICFGIADRAVEYFWTGYGGYGIWMGIWMCIAGGLGIPGTRKERSTSRNAFAGVFMGFAITSAVFGGIIIILYSIAIAYYRGRYDNNYYVYNRNDYTGTTGPQGESPTESYWGRWTTTVPYWGRTTPSDGGYYTFHRDRDHRYNAEMAFSVLLLILGIVEFAVGIWASVCLCLMNPCTCCYSAPSQQGQTMYTANPSYAINPFPVSGPLPGQVQPGGGMVTVQTVPPGAQVPQFQMVMVPFSGAVGTQPQFAQVPTSGVMTPPYQPQPIVVPPTSVHGGKETPVGEQATVHVMA